MLTLPIKRKWFDMIISGEKKEEYREFKDYYHIRFFNLFHSSIIEGAAISQIMFRAGYSKDSPSCVCTVQLSTGKGRPEWGAEPDKDYYILKILEVKEVINEKL